VVVVVVVVVMITVAVALVAVAGLEPRINPNMAAVVSGFTITVYCYSAQKLTLIFTLDST